MTTSRDNNKIKSIVKACRLITRMVQAEPDHRKSQVLYYQMLSKYFTRLLNAHEQGDFVAAHTYLCDGSGPDAHGNEHLDDGTIYR